jgi:hypothetical protein
MRVLMWDEPVTTRPKLRAAADRLGQYGLNRAWTCPARIEIQALPADSIEPLSLGFGL